MDRSTTSGLDPKPYAVTYIANPSQDELRKLAVQHTPWTFRSACGNVNKVSRNKARMAGYTYVVCTESDQKRFSGNVMEPEKATQLIERQRAYIEKQGTLLQIDGYLGVGPRAVPVQWVYTLEGANIAAMQQILSFPRSDVEPAEKLNAPFQPTLRLVYTPDLFLDDVPGRQAILVDLDRYVTYVMGPDYFGESKKGALRMLNDLVYKQGGLVLHAGAKAVHVNGSSLTMTIMGLSGTGKTTTTFSKQGQLTQPIQDDMVVLWKAGECSITENGCFAKTFGLTAESEPVIYAGTLDPSAWVENAFMNEDGSYDFSKTRLDPQEVDRLRDVLCATGAVAANVDQYITGKVRYQDVVDEMGVPKDGWDFVVWTQNGRSIIPMQAIQDAANLHEIPPVRSMGILNRDEGPDAATPGLVRFVSSSQAAGYFMLGETTKTSAAGKERGKTRSPFTQPFFPLQHSLQAQRFNEIVATMPGVDVWLMNTGYVGGDARDIERGEALKVKIRHSSAMLEALLSGQVRWKRDPDWGYDIVDVEAPENRGLVGEVPKEILEPRLLYEAKGRMQEYRDWVTRMKKERRAFLEKHTVGDEILRAVVGS